MWVNFKGRKQRVSVKQSKHQQLRGEKNASLKTQSKTSWHHLSRSTETSKWLSGNPFRIFIYLPPLHRRRKICRACYKQACSWSWVWQRGNNHWISYLLTDSCKVYSNSAVPTKTCLKMQWAIRIWLPIVRYLATTVNSFSSWSTRLVKTQECTLSKLNKSGLCRPWSWKDLQSMASRKKRLNPWLNRQSAELLTFLTKMHAQSWV